MPDPTSPGRAEPLSDRWLCPGCGRLWPWGMGKSIGRYNVCPDCYGIVLAAIEKWKAQLQDALGETRPAPRS